MGMGQVDDHIWRYIAGTLNPALSCAVLTVQKSDAAPADAATEPMFGRPDDFFNNGVDSPPNWRHITRSGKDEPEVRDGVSHSCKHIPRLACPRNPCKDVPPPCEAHTVAWGVQMHVGVWIIWTTDDRNPRDCRIAGGYSNGMLMMLTVGF